jgi:hypothetical protein
MIRDVYLGSRIRIFSIPDPDFFYPGSGSRIRIPDPGVKKALDPDSQYWIL